MVTLCGVASDLSTQGELFGGFDALGMGDDAQLAAQRHRRPQHRHRPRIARCTQHEAAIDLDPVETQVAKMRER